MAFGRTEFGSAFTGGKLARNHESTTTRGKDGDHRRGKPSRKGGKTCRQDPGREGALMADKIWVYVDHFRGEPHPASWEAIAAGGMLGEQLGGGVAAVVIGSAVEGLGQQGLPFGPRER